MILPEVWRLRLLDVRHGLVVPFAFHATTEATG